MAVSRRGAAAQPDLFSTGGDPAELPAPVVSAEVQAMVRARLHAALALVQGAPRMPWDDYMQVIREDNAFRNDVRFLPQAEGEALWAIFDAEMNRLYAIMNEGLEPDPAA